MRHTAEIGPTDGLDKDRIAGDEVFAVYPVAGAAGRVAGRVDDFDFGAAVFECVAGAVRGRGVWENRLFEISEGATISTAALCRRALLPEI